MYMTIKPGKNWALEYNYTANPQTGIVSCAIPTTFVGQSFYEYTGYAFNSIECCGAARVQVLIDYLSDVTCNMKIV